MKRQQRSWILSGIGLMLGLLGVSPAEAQTFTSGSTGALGALNPTSNVTLTMPPDGIFNYTTINIPFGVTVSFTPNAANTPVILLATGDVTVSGTLTVRGKNPGEGGASFAMPAPGGPGGFPGGICGAPPTGGSGPGGGGIGPNQADRNGTYGSPASFVSLIPLFGGSGGGGCALSDPTSFGGGGGGGGALVIASSTKITVNGSVLATGGNAGFFSGNTPALGGNGSGGAIRLVAPEVVGSGTVRAEGGNQTGTQQAGPGRIRIESFTVGYTGSSSPSASFSTAPGPVTAASTPALVNAPTLIFTSIGGIAGPATPTGSYTNADVSLPPGTTNPVPFVLTAQNIPVGTVFTLKIIPQLTAISTLALPATTGTFEQATTTADVTLPTGQVSLLLAFGSFTLPQLAWLVPEIDGEPVDRVMVAAVAGGTSTFSLVTASGHAVPFDHLAPAEQMRVARAFALARLDRG